MDNYILDYCNYTKKFKFNHNIAIVDCELNILCINNIEFFQRYSNDFAVGAKLLSCLRHLPCFELKQRIYDEIIKTKKIRGYFIAQALDIEKTYVVDRVYLSPVLNYSNEFVGIELEVIDMDGLPMINVVEDEISSEDKNSPTLTLKEREIITLKAMGKTNLEVSQILSSVHSKNVSAKTIASIILQQIYPKLNVYNKFDLIKKIHAIGLDRMIPKSLITNNQLILFPSSNYKVEI